MSTMEHKNRFYDKAHTSQLYTNNQKNLFIYQH